MKNLLLLFYRVWRPHIRPLLAGLALSVAVLASGLALLGLSGWFITASGMAGIAGIGLAFDVFRPSAGVRLLAFGRAVSRYGERLTTHEATLRGLSTLRVSLLAAMLRRPVRSLSQLRGSERLNRFTIDVDVLDGLAVRLAIPAIAAGLSLAVLLVVLSWLADLRIAAWQVGSFALGLLAAAGVSHRLGRRPSRLGQRAMQALRMRFIDMMRGRVELLAAGRLADWRRKAADAQDRLQQSQAATDRADRLAGFLVGASATAAAAGALYLGAVMAMAGDLDPATAAIGFFAALAMAEVGAPLSRGIGESGRMADAARRILPELAARPDGPAGPEPVAAAPAPFAARGTPLLEVRSLAFSRGRRRLFEDVTFTLAAGEVLALTGQSGAGKTTLLDLARGLVEPAAGSIRLAGRPLGAWTAADLARHVGYLPQRSALVSGTIAENLRLASPEAADSALWQALQVACLDTVVEGRGGLAFRLGEGGSGLSGGEMRRLAIARLVLLRPALLLLDEPTEGLDAAIASRVLARLREFLPDAAVLVAAHRPEERDWADRCLAIEGKIASPMHLI